MAILVLSGFLLAFTAITPSYGNARIVGTSAGHNNAVIEDPVYLDFLENGLRWAVGRD